MKENLISKNTVNAYLICFLTPSQLIPLISVVYSPVIQHGFSKSVDSPKTILCRKTDSHFLNKIETQLQLGEKQPFAQFVVRGLRSTLTASGGNGETSLPVGEEREPSVAACCSPCATEDVKRLKGCCRFCGKLCMFFCLIKAISQKFSNLELKFKKFQHIVYLYYS